MRTSPTHRSIRSRRQQRVARQQGAAMLVVMLVLLMGTATGIYAAHQTTFEIRAAGHLRQAMQTEYVGLTGAAAALGWTDQFRASGLNQAMERTTQLQGGAPALDLAPFEPPMLPGKRAYRLYAGDFALAFQGTITDPDASAAALGAHTPYVPTHTVDVYDDYRTTRPVPGAPADGRAELVYLNATYTARGRSGVPGLAANVGPDGRPFFEVSSDSRAYGRSGPMGL
ncbi:MAG: hypothetical protein AAF447_00270 [Myxococcota bacterium]